MELKSSAFTSGIALLQDMTFIFPFRQSFCSTPLQNCVYKLNGLIFEFSMKLRAVCFLRPLPHSTVCELNFFVFLWRFCSVCEFSEISINYEYKHLKFFTIIAKSLRKFRHPRETFKCAGGEFRDKCLFASRLTTPIFIAFIKEGVVPIVRM